MANHIYSIALAFLVSMSLLANCDALSGRCNSYTRERLNEGYRRCVYKDPLGIPTVGVGFNLMKSTARSQLRSVNADYGDVLSGLSCLTDYQIRRLFTQDMAKAVNCAKKQFSPSKWASFRLDAKSALADMAFNLGCTRFRLFRKMLAALRRNPPDYSTAADEMRNSRWCRQVKRRCDRNINCMKGQGGFRQLSLKKDKHAGC